MESRSARPAASHAALALALLALALAPDPAAAQVTAGQVDTFEDGTTNGWTVGLGPGGGGSPVPPVNVPTGGPGGDGDAFMRLTAIGGDGPGSRLSALNIGNQWAGDYLAAGVTHIRMDAINLGSTEIFLRIMVADPIPGPPVNVAFSFTPIVLPPGSGWLSIAFPLFGPDGLVAVEGTLEGALANATELRIFHNVEFAFTPSPVVATLGVDNITAAVVPEPGTFLLLCSGLLVLVLLRNHPRLKR